MSGDGQDEWAMLDELLGMQALAARPVDVRVEGAEPPPKAARLQ